MSMSANVAAALAAIFLYGALAAYRPVQASDAPASPPPGPAAMPAAAATPPVAVPAAEPAAPGKEAPASADVPEVVMAWVGDRKITVEQFMRYITQDTRLVLKARAVPGKTEILREIILDRVLEEAMFRQGLLPKDHAPNAQDYAKAYQQLAKQHFPLPATAPAEEELFRYYQKHPEAFGIPGMVRVSQIQFRLPEKADDAAKAATKAKAESALKRLRAGEPFADVAEALTENPQAKVAKGDLGFLQPEKDAWLKKSVENLKVGQFSEVLESPVGYEIILLQDKRDAMVAPYANVRESILQRIRQEAQAKAREQYAWKLAKEIGVKVQMPELKGAVPESTP